MIIGTINMGKMQEHKDQYITTKFFALGIPLFPVGSHFMIDSERGLDIGVHGKSTLKGYISMFSLIGAVLGFLWNPLLGMVMAGIAIYFFFFFGKATEEEMKERDLFQSITGINATPEILGESGSRNLRNSVVQRFMQQDPTVNAQKLVHMIQTKQYPPQMIPLLYAFIAYHHKASGSTNLMQLKTQMKLELQNYLATGGGADMPPQAGPTSVAGII